jgi:hypothetical protein
MALTNTSLAAACTASDLTLSITSTSSGFPTVGTLGNRQLMLVDGEYMLIDHVPVAGTVVVKLRGYEGTSAVAHDVLAPVSTSASPSDFPTTPTGASTPRPPYVDAIVSIGQDGDIACPTRNTTFLLDKATALASTTLASPTVAQNGIRATFTSNTAAAHVITATMEDGTTGGSTTATFTAFKGASMILEASAGVWNVVAVQNVTIS